MARKLHARRYAQAAFEIALEKNELDRWQSDIRKIASLVDNREVMALLEAPRVRFEDKVRLLTERLPGASPLALNLASLLVARNRAGIAPDIADEFDKLVNSYRRVEQAEVITAVPLSDAERQALKARLKEIIGKEITLKSDVDPGLIGGVIIRVNDKLIDGSTRSRLLTLKKELVGVGS